MRATELPIDLTTSFAQRVGGRVRLVLGVSQPPPAGARELRLTSRKRTVSVPVRIADGDVIEVRVPEDELPPGVWRLALVAGGEPIVLGARLVANDCQPVALLPGPTPTTRMAPPKPQSREAPVSSRTTRRRVRHAAANTVDTALAFLPDPRRRKVRSALARVGRSVLR